MGRLLQEMYGLSGEALARALEVQRGSGRRIGSILVEAGEVGEEEVARALARQLGLSYLPPPLTLVETRPPLPRSLLEARGMVPVSAARRRVLLAMADPLEPSAVDEVQFRLGQRVEPAVASPGAVEAALSADTGGLTDLLAELPDGVGARVGSDSEEEVEEAARSAPVVRLVDRILREAVEGRASDIHLESGGDEVRVRYRVDGVLRTAHRLPATVRAPLLSRLKVMAGMDISVKRRPQDGGLALSHGERSLRVRVSTLPVGRGEKAVLRILDPSGAPSGLEDLGLANRDRVLLRRLLAGGQGVVLAAGPTGSGKTSTLAAALAELDREGRNLVTLEDPVEYRIPGANQVQVHPRAGLTFPAALRAVLRQDPDVVLVGEIRDRETAEIAMAAAVTGHLVLSTIHTVDAPGAVSRLLHMGVPPYLVAGGLTGVVAQRLVRRLCASCQGREEDGCPACSGGYKGRTGVFQVLVMTDAMREVVVAGGSTAEIRRLAQGAGMGSLADDARRKVAEGLSTPHEVARVIQADPGGSTPCQGCEGEIPMGALGCPSCGRARIRVCRCGGEIRPGWRFCPACLARAGG